MHETIVRVLELSSTIEKEKWSSENYLNKIFFNYSRTLEIQDKIGTIVCFHFTDFINYVDRILWSCFLF